jgi:elongation factor G
MLEGMEAKVNAQVIKAKVPLSEMFGYVTQLRTITSGRATSVMEFHSFQAAPESVASTVIAKNQGKVRSSAVEE